MIATGWKTLAFTCVWGALALATTGALAQSYPERPISLVVPFAAGGVTDVSARLIAQQMSGPLGGSVVVENRSGGGGMIGAIHAARAASNGYTLFFANSATNAILPAMSDKLEYDPIKSFAAVGMVSSASYLLVINADLPVKTAQDLADHANANPGKLNFGAPTGTPPQILANLFKNVTKANFAVIPYRGGAPAMSDLLRGEVHAIFQTTSVILPLIEDKRIRIVGILAENRSPLLPHVPTMKEMGFPNFLASSGNGIAVPAGTPRPVIDRLNAAVNEGLRSPQLKAAFAKLGLSADIGTPDEYADFMVSQLRHWETMVKEAGVKLGQ